MNRAAVDRPLENKHRGALRIIGVFLDDDRRTSAQEELVDREPIVGQSVVSVLGYPNIAGCVRWTLDFGRPDKVEFSGREAPYQEQDDGREAASIWGSLQGEGGVGGRQG
jgi:hypothetical protein